jgi:uncharacterized membrane protein
VSSVGVVREYLRQRPRVPGTTVRAVATELSSPTTDDERIDLEPRWPLALVVGFYLVISVILRIAEPNRPSVGPHWLVPAIEAGLLLVLVAADPSHISRRARWLRRVGIALVFGLVGVTITSTIILIDDLITGGRATESASLLLSSGALVWLGNAMVFSLLYWQFDSGGPLARYRHERTYPDLLFTQQASPEFAPPDWRPQFVDYLVLGVTTNMAFSPTDVMPMARWAKLTMTLQSVIALVVIGLVIARAVNIFT